MKRRIISKPLIILLVISCIAACIPGVYAYMIRRTEPIENTLIPAFVDCTVYDGFDGTYKTWVTVKNEDSNINAYVRLRVVTYWVDSKGSPIAGNSPELSIVQENSDVAVPWNTINWAQNGWIYDAANQTFYYTSPIEPGQSTSDLLPEGYRIKLASDEETVGTTIFTYHQVVEFIAEAIQCDPENAVENSWHVTVNDNKITAVN